LFLWAVACRVGWLTADWTCYLHLWLCTKWTCPCSVALLLTILTIIVIEHTHKLWIQPLQHCLNFFILLTIQYLLHFVNTLIQLLIIISNDNNMQGLKVLENIFLFFISTTTSNSYPTTTSFFDDFLCLSLWTYQLTYIISFRVVYSLLCEINLFELFQRFVIFGWDESKKLLTI